MALARPRTFDAGDVPHRGANAVLPEYLMEGAELGLLMLSVTALSVLLLPHGAGAQRLIHSALLRRGLLGAGVGVLSLRWRSYSCRYCS
jgi:hypothetical protein